MSKPGCGQKPRRRLKCLFCCETWVTRLPEHKLPEQCPRCGSMSEGRLIVRVTDNESKQTAAEVTEKALEDTLSSRFAEDEQIIDLEDERALAVVTSASEDKDE